MIYQLCNRLITLKSAIVGLLLVFPLASGAAELPTAFQLNLTGTGNDPGLPAFCYAQYTVPAGKHVHIGRVSYLGSSALTVNAALGAQVLIGGNIAGALNPPNAGPNSLSGTGLIYYGNQATDIDADAGALVSILFQFAQHDSNQTCDIVIAGTLVSI